MTRLCGLCGNPGHYRPTCPRAAATQPAPAPAENIPTLSPGRGELLADQRGGARDELVAPPLSALVATFEKDTCAENIDAPRSSRRLRSSPGPRGNDASLQAYLRSIRAYPVLSREEEHDIAVRFVATRAPALAQQLVQANLRFVVKEALRYRVEREKLLDLIQEGNLGLMRAVEKFDPHAGFKLTTYAVAWIKAYIMKFIMVTKRLVKMGTTVEQRTCFTGLARTRVRLEMLHGRPATSAEVAAELHVSEEVVDEMTTRLGASEGPLDRRPSGQDDDERHDWIAGDAPAADELLERRSEAEAIRAAVESVRPSLGLRERLILDSRLLADEPVTLDSLAETFGVSKERARQLEVRVKEALARRMRQRFGEAA